MADLKISALTASTTPLAGTEVLPIVQSSTTKQVSVANLTAGRAVSALSLTTTSNITANSGSTSAIYLQAVNSGGQTGFGTENSVGGSFATGTQPYSGVFYNYAARPIYMLVNGVINTTFDTSGNATIATGNLVIGTSGKGIDFSATSGTGTSELLADYEEGTWTPNQGSGVTVVGAFASSGTYTKIGRTVTVVGEMSGATSIAIVAGDILSTNLPFTINKNSAGAFTSGVATGGQVIAVGSSTTLYSTTTVGASARSIIFTVTYTV